MIEVRGELLTIEIMHTASPKLSRGFHNACEDLLPAKAFFVYGGTERYPLTDTVEAIGLEALMAELAEKAR